MPFTALISFDLPQLDKSLGGVRRSYTDLGKAVQDMTKDVAQSAKDVALKVSTVSSVMKSARAAIGPSISYENETAHLDGALGIWNRENAALKSALVMLESSNKSNANLRPNALLSTLPMDDTRPPMIEDAKVNVDQSMRGSDSVFKELEKQNKEMPKTVSASWKFILSEVKDARGVIKKTLANLPGGISGGFMSGVIGTITLGFMEKDRKRAQLGEMVNAFASGVDSILEPSTRKAAGWFARWAEYAQRHYGMSREDIQKAAGLMVDTAFTTEQIMEHFDDRLGKLGKNIVVASFAVDKHFNVQTGSSMTDIVNLVSEHGMELHKGGELYIKMAAAGQKSGMGGTNFIRTVMSASEAMSRFGGNVEDVAVMLNNISKAYQSMGLDKRYAGAQAAGVAMDLVSAFLGMSTAMKVELTRRSTGDRITDSFTIQNMFDDGLRRVNTPEGDAFFRTLVSEYLKMMREQHGRRNRAQSIKAHQDILGIKNKSAVILEDYADTLFEGGKLEEAGKSDWDQLKKSMEIESGSVNSLEKTRLDLVTAMAQVGQGLLGVVTNLVAIAALGLRALPLLWRGLKAGKLDETLTGLSDMNQLFIRRAGASMDSVATGLELAGSTLGAEFRGVYQPIIKILTERPPSLAAKAKQVAASVASSAKSGGLKLYNVLFSKEWGEKARLIQQRDFNDSFMGNQWKSISQLSQRAAMAASMPLTGSLKLLGLSTAVDIAFPDLLELEGRLMAWHEESQREDSLAEAAEQLRKDPKTAKVIKEFQDKLLKTGRWERDPKTKQVRPKLTKEQRQAERFVHEVEKGEEAPPDVDIATLPLFSVISDVIFEKIWAVGK